jgi:hypothetical protein
VVTPIHYLSYYTDEGLVTDDDLVDGKRFSKAAPRYLRKYVTFFADLCLQGIIGTHNHQHLTIQ